MNDILFGNNNSKVITKLSKRYFKKNKVRNLAALLAIILTAFLFTSITSLAFNMASSIQLSLQMQKGSKADGTLGYMTEEQYEQLVNSDFVDQAGHRRIIGYASNTSSHSIEINYADSVQQELTFCVPTHGAAPEKANEIATTDLALKALGVEPEIGAEVSLEFELQGKTYHYDMVLSGWWEASNGAKPSSDELKEIFNGHIAKDTLILTDGLRSYNVLETLAGCTVVDINHEACRGMFHLNTVNSLHSYIKKTYVHYRGVATKYINRYNALFSIAFRCANDMKDTLFAALSCIGQTCYWHSVKDVRNYRLVTL